MTLLELAAEANRLSKLIDKGVAALTDSARKAAEAEQAYRKEKGRAWHLHTDGTAKEREAQVDAVTADLRFARDLAEAGRQAALEALRSRRQQLSAVQSIAAAWRSEAEMARYGTGDTP